MNRALWIARRNEMCTLIKQISDAYGGDDREWLKEYAKDLIEREDGYFEKPIACFVEVLRGAPKKPHSEPVIASITVSCPECGYVPPFCYYLITKECTTLKQNVPQGT